MEVSGHVCWNQILLAIMFLTKVNNDQSVLEKPMFGHMPTQSPVCVTHHSSSRGGLWPRFDRAVTTSDAVYDSDSGLILTGDSTGSQPTSTHYETIGSSETRQSRNTPVRFCGPNHGVGWYPLQPPCWAHIPRKCGKRNSLADFQH